MELDVRVIDIPGNIVMLAITGRIKSGYLTPLENEFKKLTRGAPVKLILDVRHVDAIDSSGIGELIKARADITGRGGKIVLIGGSSRVDMMIKLSGLDNYFSVVASESDAIQLLKSDDTQPPSSQ